MVGLPLRLDGTPGEMAEEATRFSQRLHKQLGVPVALVDERLTSWEAERVLEEELGRRISSVSAKPGRPVRPAKAAGKYTVDAVAAMLILREYLSQLPAGENPA